MKSIANGRRNQMENNMDTMNKFAVGVRASQVTFPVGLPAIMSKDDALLLAAWIVAIADDGEKFDKILDAVVGT